jgi:arylsulfatase A-like enzyme
MPLAFPIYQNPSNLYTMFFHLRITTLILVLVVSSAFAQEPVSTSQDRPNILWIVGENMKLDLGIYGAENVYTPHLDSLAANGLRFTHVFSTSPVCAPSRSAFMVGMYQTTTDTHNMRSHRDDDYRLPEGVRPITHRLQDVGYFTANISYIGNTEVGTGKLDLNFVNEGPIYQSDDWSELKNNEPFFAQINMPEAEYDIYDRQTWKHPRVKWYGEDDHPQVATADHVNPPPYYPDHPVVREEWARYLNSISGMDVRIGWILDQLRRDGLADNTIIVFFGDNGRMEPRGIHWPWDTGLHVPMIIHYPENVSAPPQYEVGGVNDDVISLLDITATTMWMAGIDRPAGMQSRLFLGERPDPPRTFAFSARDRIDETALRMRSVRGKKYHYIRNYSEGEGFSTLNRYKEKCFMIKPLMRQMLATGELTGPALELMQPMPYELLYDTEADPHEISNLAQSTNPADREALFRMRAALDTWETETGDLGRWPEPEGIIAPFVQEMHDWFGTPDWYRN